MFATLGLHLNRLSSRRLIRRERLDPVRIEATLRFFAHKLPALLDAERCNIYVYDPASAKAWVEAGTGLGVRAFELPTNNTLVGVVIATGRPRILDAAAELRGTCDDFDVALGAAVRSTACVPIRSRHHDEVIGVIEAQDKRGGEDFTAADLATLEDAATIIQDLVDSLFLNQKVYGAADAVVTGSRLTAEATSLLLLLGSMVTLLVIEAWPAIPVITGAFDLSLLPFIAGSAP